MEDNLNNKLKQLDFLILSKLIIKDYSGTHSEPSNNKRNLYRLEAYFKALIQALNSHSLRRVDSSAKHNKQGDYSDKIQLRNHFYLGRL